MLPPRSHLPSFGFASLEATDVPQRRELINITYEIQECLRESGIQEGLLLVNAMQCTVLPISQPACLSTTTNAGCTRITTTGWKTCVENHAYPRANRLAATVTTAPVMIMPTRI